MVEIITIIANVALTLSFIVALIFGIVQVRVARGDRKERFTIETLRNFQSREFAELIHFVSTRTPPPTYMEFLTMPEDEQVIIIQFGQHMEHLGFLVVEGLINIDLVDKTLGSFVTVCWEKYRPWYMDIRRAIEDPFMGEYFEWLAKRIATRMNSSPRQPYYLQQEIKMN